MRHRAKLQRRSGLTVVESALLLSIFMMFLMAIFEYGRYLLVSHVATNAARSGARYATVNVDKPDNFDTVNTSTHVSIRQHVINQMGGINTLVQNFNVTVFPVDSTQMYQDPVVIAPKASYTTWKQATFTERIGVRITGDYRPILPVFVFFYTGSSNSIPISVTACSGSEG